MSEFLTLTTAAFVSVGVIAGASFSASANTMSVIQNSATPAPGLSSVPQGGAMNPGAHPGGGNGGDLGVTDAVSGPVALQMK